jgi:hypothetical protein
MALSDYLRGDLFSGVTESGGQGSRALYDAYLGNAFRDWGGAFSPQAQALGNQFQPVWSQYLSEILSASPEVGLPSPRFAGRQGAGQPSSFVDFLRTSNFDQMYGGLPPAARGAYGSRFQPIVRRVR